MMVKLNSSNNNTQIIKKHYSPLLILKKMINNYRFKLNITKNKSVKDMLENL